MFYLTINIFLELLNFFVFTVGFIAFIKSEYLLLNFYLFTSLLFIFLLLVLKHSVHASNVLKLVTDNQHWVKDECCDFFEQGIECIYHLHLDVTKYYDNDNEYKD